MLDLNRTPPKDIACLSNPDQLIVAIACINICPRHADEATTNLGRMFESVQKWWKRVPQIMSEGLWHVLDSWSLGLRIRDFALSFVCCCSSSAFPVPGIGCQPVHLVVPRNGSFHK